MLISKSNKEDITMVVYSHMIYGLSNKLQEYIKIDNSLAILKNINRTFIKHGITFYYGDYY